MHKYICTLLVNAATKTLSCEFVDWYSSFSVRLKDDVKYNYQGPRTKDGILDFATRVSG